MSDNAKNITEIKWNAYSSPVSFACVGDIEIETIQCDFLQKSKVYRWFIERKAKMLKR